MKKILTLVTLYHKTIKDFEKAIPTFESHTYSRKIYKFLYGFHHPIISNQSSYYRFKKAYSKKMFEWVLNRDHLIQVFENFNYKLIKESTVNSNESLSYSSILLSTVTFSFKKL